MRASAAPSVPSCNAPSRDATVLFVSALRLDSERIRGLIGDGSVAASRGSPPRCRSTSRPIAARSRAGCRRTAATSRATRSASSRSRARSTSTRRRCGRSTPRTSRRCGRRSCAPRARGAGAGCSRRWPSFATSPTRPRSGRRSRWQDGSSTASGSSTSSRTIRATARTSTRISSCARAARRARSRRCGTSPSATAALRAAKWQPFGFVRRDAERVFLFNDWAITDEAVTTPADQDICIRTWFGQGAASFRIVSLHPFTLSIPKLEQPGLPTVHFGFPGEVNESQAEGGNGGQRRQATAERVPEHPSRPAWVRLAVGVIVGLAASICIPDRFGATLKIIGAWDAGAVAMTGLAWWLIARAVARAHARLGGVDRSRAPRHRRLADPRERRSACSRPASRSTARSPAPPTAAPLFLGLGLLAVAVAWVMTHTMYTLRYAHLYYRDGVEREGGLAFPGPATRRTSTSPTTPSPSACASRSRTCRSRTPRAAPRDAPARRALVRVQHRHPRRRPQPGDRHLRLKRPDRRFLRGADRVSVLALFSHEIVWLIGWETGRAIRRGRSHPPARAGLR